MELGNGQNEDEVSTVFSESSSKEVGRFNGEKPVEVGRATQVMMLVLKIVKDWASEMSEVGCMSAKAGEGAMGRNCSWAAFSFIFYKDLC